MNDLISRQAVLDLAYLSSPATHSKPYGGKLVIDAEDVEKLPSIDNKVFVVTYFDKDSDEPTITVFDNKEAAVKARNYFSSHYKYAFIDCDVNVYNNFSLVHDKGTWIRDAETYYNTTAKKGVNVSDYPPYISDNIVCSECFAAFNKNDNETKLFKYCPNCGSYNGGK